MCLKYKKRKLYIHVIFNKINEKITYFTYTENTLKGIRIILILSTRGVLKYILLVLLLAI